MWAPRVGPERKLAAASEPPAAATASDYWSAGFLDDILPFAPEDFRRKPEPVPCTQVLSCLI